MTTTTQTATDPNEQFLTAAIKAVIQTAKTKRNFIVDDVWAAIPADAPKPTDPRIMSGVISGAAKQGLITGTTKTKKSPRRRSYTKVWKSLTYGV